MIQKNMRIISSRERLLDSICNLCVASQSSEKMGEASSFAISEYVQELLRENMRRFAQQGGDNWQSCGLIAFATDNARDVIQARLNERELEFEQLESILKEAKAGLEKIENHLQRLSNKFTETKKGTRLKRIEPKRDTSLKEMSVRKESAKGPFTIVPIGLESFLTGLLASPDEETELEWNLQALEEIGCDFADESFPIEVTFESHIFVVDDDGSVYVSIDGLLENAVSEVEDKLDQFANALYSRTE